MCIADWQLGRLIRAVPRRVTVGTQTTQVTVFNKDRVAISFACNDADDNVTVSPVLAGDLVAAFVVNAVSATTPVTDAAFTHMPHNLHFTLKDHGDLPMQVWNAIADSELSLFIVEYILPEDVLHLTPDELRRRAG